MNKIKQTIGFIGYGNLGQLLSGGFSDLYNIVYFDTSKNLAIKTVHKRIDSIGELVDVSDIILIATPASSFGAVIKQIINCGASDKLIIDVLSTKVLADDIYNNYKDNLNNILSLHPLFGPPSYRNFQKDLRVVVCKSMGDKSLKFLNLLRNHYNFKLIEITADEHDKHMALHHAVPYVLAHALSKIDFNKNPSNLTIPSEEKLRRIVDIANNESDSLYKTIVSANPYAEAAIQDLTQAINSEVNFLWPNNSAQKKVTIK